MGAIIAITYFTGFICVLFISRADLLVFMLTKVVTISLSEVGNKHH